VISVAAAEEESRLRQRNRLTLEENKPAVERCLEELVFGDVEDDEDALLRRLRGSRVREASVRAGRALAGRAVGGEVPGAEPG
jgi:U3 small nucleolar RNA-associated protein 18